MKDYEWSHAEPTTTSADRSPEAWLRLVFDGAPRALRAGLPIAWRYGLGLRLGSTSDPARILGCEIAHRCERSAAIAVDSRLLVGTNELEVASETIRWRTTLKFSNRLGQTIWTVVRPVHELVIPFLMRRALRTTPPVARSVQ